MLCTRCFAHPLACETRANQRNEFLRKVCQAKPFLRNFPIFGKGKFGIETLVSFGWPLQGTQVPRGKITKQGTKENWCQARKPIPVPRNPCGIGAKQALKGSLAQEFATGSLARGTCVLRKGRACFARVALHIPLRALQGPTEGGKCFAWPYLLALACEFGAEQPCLLCTRCFAHPYFRTQRLLRTNWVASHKLGCFARVLANSCALRGKIAQPVLNSHARVNFVRIHSSNALQACEAELASFLLPLGIGNCFAPIPNRATQNSQAPESKIARHKRRFSQGGLVACFASKCEVSQSDRIRTYDLLLG